MPPKSTEELLKQSTATAQKAAEAIGGTFKQNVGFQPLTSDSLRQEDEIVITETQPAGVEASGLLGQIEAQTDQFNENLSRQGEQREKDLTSSREDLVRTFQSQETPTEAQISAEEKVGLSEIDRELQEINDEIRQEQQSLQRKIEQIQTGSGTATKAQRDVAVAEARRVSARKQADLAIIQLSKQGRYDSAKAIVGRAVQAQLESQRQELQVRQFIYQENKDLFTKSEQRLFETRQADRNRALDRIEREKELIQKYAINARANGASEEIMRTMLSSESLDDALSVGGGFVDRLSRIERQLKIQKLQDEVAQSENEELMQELLKSYEVGSTEYNRLLIAQSSKFDKEFDQSQREKVEQATSALASIENLNTLLLQGKDGVDLTGPRIGRQRELLSKLGGDADAAAINATIQGLVPTVARGIFGEVGVLTDTDIANYKKTLPNLTSTREQNQLISTIMLDVLNRSVENTLTTAARAGQNASRFIDVYDQVQMRVEDQKQKIGVTGFEEQDDDEFLNQATGEVSTQEFFLNLNNSIGI